MLLTAEVSSSLGSYFWSLFTFQSCNLCFRTIRTLNTVPTEAPLFTADQGGLQVSTPHVLEIMKDVLSHELCSQFQNPMHKIHPTF